MFICTRALGLFPAVAVTHDGFDPAFAWGAAATIWKTMAFHCSDADGHTGETPASSPPLSLRSSAS